MCRLPRRPLAHLIVALAVTAGPLVLSCTERSEADLLSGPRAAAAKEKAELALAGLDPRVRELWSRHDRTLEMALTKQWRNQELDDAQRFFDQLVPVSLHLDFQYVGTVPTPATKEALIELREWLVLNANRLYWDEPTATVRVRPSPS